MPITLDPAQKANYDTVMSVITLAAQQRKFQTIIPEDTLEIVVDKLLEEGFRKSVGEDTRITIKWGKSV